MYLLQWYFSEIRRVYSSSSNIFSTICLIAFDSNVLSHLNFNPNCLTEILYIKVFWVYYLVNWLDYFLVCLNKSSSKFTLMLSSMFMRKSFFLYYKRFSDLFVTEHRISLSLVLNWFFNNSLCCQLLVLSIRLQDH